MAGQIRWNKSATASFTSGVTTALIISEPNLLQMLGNEGSASVISILSRAVTVTGGTVQCGELLI